MSNLNDDTTPMSKAVLKLLKKIFKLGRGNTPAIDKTTIEETAQHFMEAVYKGYGENFGTVEYNSPDYRKLAHLERNVYQFSGAKNYQMLRDFTSLLRDGDRIVPEKEFINRAAAIDHEYNEVWRKVEYHTAIGGSQMASKAVEYDQHPKDLIEYRGSEDDRECPICRPFNGIILPWDHPFWRTAMPLNHHGCLCTTIRHKAALATRTPEKEIPGFDTIPAMFRTNLAETGLIFPKHSPYFIGIPDEVKKNINKIIPDRGK